MVDGIKVVVPDSLDLITPYVLREQLDWFEDEIRFLRRMLQPGQQIVDIGANYGVYTLSIAKVVGSSGHVWSFEPAATTAALLNQSIAANNFDQVTLEQCALSEKEGTAQLSMSTHAELNALVHDNRPAQSTETVRLITLDGYAAKSGWHDIDFIKIDAEGEEINILKSGGEFFATNSPLVQYEIKAGKDIQLDLVWAFAELGYDAYRLVPCLDVLVPFHADEPVDPFQLNLFACKQDRAAELASDGWLISDVPELKSSGELPRDISPDVFAEHAFDWRIKLATLPYGKKLASLWERTVIGEEAGAVEQALALYALSRDASRSATERFCALDCSFRRFRRLAEASPTHPRLASLARIAREHGARVIALDTLLELCTSIEQNHRVDLDEPFLAPGERFDTLDPGEALGDWMMVGAAEESERARAFSTFYPGLTARDRLEWLCRSTFAGPEMHRRLSLLRQRFNLPEA